MKFTRKKTLQFFICITIIFFISVVCEIFYFLNSNQNDHQTNKLNSLNFWKNFLLSPNIPSVSHPNLGKKFLDEPLVYDIESNSDLMSNYYNNKKEWSERGGEGFLEGELRSSIRGISTIENDCKFCSYPKYVKNFKGPLLHVDTKGNEIFVAILEQERIKHNNYVINRLGKPKEVWNEIKIPELGNNGIPKQTYTFMDAFISDYGNYITILSSYKQGIEDFDLFAKFITSDDVVLSESERYMYCGKGEVDVENPVVHNRNVIFKCKILKKHKILLSTCFHMQLYDMKDIGRKNPLLTEPIFVRHCNGKSEIETKKKNLSICSMITNNVRWIVEWIEYHLMLGVENFFLYFDSGKQDSYDSTFLVLKEYMEKGIVSIFLWNYTRGVNSRQDIIARHPPEQTAAQNDCINRFGDFFKWMILIDDDEFVVPIKEDSLIAVAKKFENDKFNSLRIYQHHFTNDRLDTDSTSIIDLYPKFEKVWYGKSFVQPHLVKLYAVHKSFLSEEGTVRKDLDVKLEAHVAHYSYRKHFSKNRIINETEIPKDRDENYVYTIRKFIKPLKKRMEKVKKRFSKLNKD